MNQPSHDVVVFGATSFVGQIICRHLAREYGADGDSLRWAIAGRSRARLASLRDELNAPQLPFIVANARDDEQLRQLCESTRVVLSTVGPYALYGEALVRTCAETGTDYCDLTGEVPWLGRMIRRYEALARRNGARLVPCCGFDSLPSDLGVLFLQGEAQRRLGQPCTQVKMRVAGVRGGFSGGTAASLLNVMRESSADAALRRELADPYSLCPEGHGFSARQPAVTSPRFERDMNSWAAPFIMAAINTRVVFRSNALSGGAYGRDFRYDEASLTGAGWKGRAGAYGLSAGLGGLMLTGMSAPGRWLLEKLVLPAPGEGPSPEAQTSGYFDLRFVGHTETGERIETAVSGDRDPGYGATARMIGEAAVSLATEHPEREGGFWTPATLFGDALLERLRQRAGMGFTVVS